MATEKELPVSTSVPPEFPAEQRSLFCEVLEHLNRAGIPYVVSGAFALQQHTGIWRNTKDLDLFLTNDVVPEALRHLREQGFETEVRDPVWLAKAHRDGYFVDLITGMSNAVITVDQSWIDRSSPCVVLGVRTRVLAAEELIASKLFVNFRERFDGADVVHIIYGTQGAIDWNRLLQLVGEHWELLLWELMLFHYVYPAKQNYVPRCVWNELLSRFQHELDSAPAHSLPRQPDRRENVLYRHERMGHGKPAKEQREHREPMIEENNEPRSPWKQAEEP